MHDNDAEAEGNAVVSTRTMDMVVALILLIGSVVFIFDSIRSGIGWRDDGPAPGFFPFWVAALLAGASIMNLIRALADKGAADEAFVLDTQFLRVLAVLVPTTLYVGAIGGIEIGPLKIPGLGIYLASAIFVAGFMGMLSDAGGASLASRGVLAIGAMIVAGGLTAALLWLVTKGSLGVVGIDVPYALMAGIALVCLPFGAMWKNATLGPAVAMGLYAMFEVWFKVPLVKGPVEVLLGIG